MNTFHHRAGSALCLCGLAGLALAQTPPQFTTAQRLANKEVRLLLNVPTNLSYQVQVSSNLLDWQPIVTWRGVGINQHTDAAAPYLDLRYYRAQQLSTTNDLTGDHLSTTNGDVVIHPVDHAGFVLSWNGLTIYADPVAGSFAGIPKADLLFITHIHGDHFDQPTMGAVWKTNSIFVAPQEVYNSISSTSLKNVTSVMTNGAQTNFLGIQIQAVPAYNANHPPGAGNGYVLTIGGKRLYFSGDTGNTAEMRALTNIDVAFLCMNTPYTMLTTEATNAVRAFRPKVVYPYHYRNQDGTTGNAALFKQQLGADLGIEVRLRKWY